MQKPHISLAQNIWKKHLKKGSHIIDATLGNGYDTLFLANLILEKDSGWIHSFDIQKKAIDASITLLQTNLNPHLFQRISFHQKSHETFEIDTPIDLIIYNLGYLPKGDKSITTKVISTLSSIKQALKIIKPNGLITITCYPGHFEGKKEEIAILDYLRSLDSNKYLVCYHNWINREKAPSLIVISKAN